MTLNAALRAVRGAAPLLLIAAAAVPSQASAQATRTWVSGVGDDANPCSRTAPCKTFAGAISKTATSGEINVLDPGGFGAVTITKSITINGGRQIAGVLTSAGNGININGSTDNIRVRLRNLDINGLNTASSGIRITNNTADVRIDDCEIFGFTAAGVDVATGNGVSRRVQIRNTSIHGNYGSADTAGILLRPTGGNTLTAKVVVSDSYIDDNANGVVVDATNARAKITVRNSTIDDNGTGGGTGHGVKAINPEATVRLSGSEVTGNTLGLTSIGSGLITSFGNNVITANDGGNTPTNTIPLS